MQALTALQAEAHRLPHALAGYLWWLAPQMGTIGSRVQQIFTDTRARATTNGIHLRQPEVVANLWIGVELALAYATEIGAVSYSDGEALRHECWDALTTVVKAQRHDLDDEKPSSRFLSVMQALYDQGRVEFYSKESNAQADFAPGVEMVGWEDKEFVYLIPDATYRVVTKYCREGEMAFPVGSDRLWHDLKREGLSLNCEEGRNKASVWIAGKSRRVVKMRRSVLLGKADA